MDKSSSKAVAVIGAGPAGLTAAYELAKAGVPVEVFEASAAVGGMAKTIELWGQLVDLGPHRFFSSDPRVNKIWLEVVGSDYDMVDRLTRIYYKGTFFNYPLEAFNALKGLGPFEALRCICSYVVRKCVPLKDDSTFENWVINRFGERLFSIFFRSYSEKLWGISCQNLDADFAVQRIKKLSLFEAIKAALISKKTHHKTLVQQFAYPLAGTGIVYQTMANRISELGGVIHLNTPIMAVLAGKDSALPMIQCEDGTKRSFAKIISSMPITALVKSMGAPADIIVHALQLRFRNTILVFLEIAQKDLFQDQWIYIHSPELKTGRITNFSNWVPAINRGSHNTIICMEYWCYGDDPQWVLEESALIALATKEAYATSLVPTDAVLRGHVVKLPKCYPVYAHGYKNALKPVEEYLSSIKDIAVIGRYGAFKYNNQDHSILMGLLAAENITQAKQHNLWDVNSDYEYQEASIISKTGLQKIDT